jgi:CDP-diacylglycerol--serine O-phosphatidyltransferase
VAIADVFDPGRPGRAPRQRRRGYALLPNIFTIGNLFCGYACIVYASRGDVETAAPFIGVAFLLDSLDGSIARLTNSASPFGLQLDSLADVVSFGIAPGILAFIWGLSDFGRWGWAVGFIFTACAASRLARFNIQAGQVDKRYFVGMPSPAAASVIAATVFAWPDLLTGHAEPVRFLLKALASAVVLVPATLMVSTIKFRSFKTLNLGWRRSRKALLAFVLVLTLIVSEPSIMLAIMAYGYLLSAFVGLAITRWRARRGTLPPDAPPVAT